MMNLHAATSLAEELGLDLIDIYGIRKWEAMQASPLNDPDIVAEMVKNLPVEEFGKHLLLNRTWYARCKAELWKQHKKAEEAYNLAANICKKAERAFWRDCADGGRNFDKLAGEYTKVNQEKHTRFEEMVVIEQAILCCGFISKEINKGEYIRMTYNIELFKDGDTPDEDAFGDSDDDSDDSDDEE
ncbi:unnamed protein product [Rhizophagus irregularis]|nr:unnamed protein product [Rhizophagus irregularis]